MESKLSLSIRLFAGLLFSLMAMALYAGFTATQLRVLRRLQTDIIDRNRRDSLLLLRAQNDLNNLGLSMRDMLDTKNGYPLTAWRNQFQRIRTDLEDAFVKKSKVATSIRTPDQAHYLALRWIEEGARLLPENREVLLLKATTLEFAHRAADAEQLLVVVQKRWPEWSGVWSAHGIILAAHQHCEEARQALENAVTLGARNPETYFFLADCTLRSGAQRKDAAETLIREALKLSPDDAWIQALGGRIAFEKGDYQLAVERQRAAIRLRPGFKEAHNSLAKTYAALGRKQEAAAELEKIKTIESAGDEPPYLARLFEGRLLEEKTPNNW